MLKFIRLQFSGKKNRLVLKSVHAVNYTQLYMLSITLSCACCKVHSVVHAVHYTQLYML